MKRESSSYRLEDRLFNRELGSPKATVKSIYGDRSFVNDLDIVNELKGHNGCVNALSWSSSGKILASGSDDRVINLFSYLPSDSGKQFKLASSIRTGHTRNIFSVKFMPHSGDRSIVCCAGDAQVKVFDIERAAIVGGDMTDMSFSSANGKNFLTHVGAVKRIVTEASPYYFLTCAEDGTIRQWDTRQPMSAYPRPRGLRYDPENEDNSIPPPLISYRDYNIDIYSMSCSPSQPHYIAIGGTHLHCFLHDRRMLGRDKLSERGGRGAAVGSSGAETSMEEATKCVRRFAPNGQHTMGRAQSAQITAVKISNANPNELLASWSADHIYSFDIHRDDDANANKTYKIGQQAKEGQKKRKRADGSASSLRKEGDQRAQQSNRSVSAEPTARSEPVSLLVRLRNGETVEIPIQDDMPLPQTAVAPAATDEGSSIRPHSMRIAQGVASIKRELFVCHSEGGENSYYKLDDSLADREDAMVKVVCEAAGVFEMVDDAISRWAYPTTTSGSAIAFQQKLRDDRAKTWRCVQAAGTLARVLLKMSPQGNDWSELPKALDYFDYVRYAPRESSRPLDRREHFAYDFIRAVCLWIDSGIGAVIGEFTFTPESSTRYMRRQPIPEGLGEDSIRIALIPYLLRLASQQPVVDVDPNADGEDHIIFSSETDAVSALARAMEMPFDDLFNDVGMTDQVRSEGSSLPASQKRETALKFWVMRVGRSLLRSAAADVDFSLVDIAFDGMNAGAKPVRTAPSSIVHKTTPRAEAASSAAPVASNGGSQNDAQFLSQHGLSPRDRQREERRLFRARAGFGQDDSEDDDELEGAHDSDDDEGAEEEEIEVIMEGDDDYYVHDSDLAADESSDEDEDDEDEDEDEDWFGSRPIVRSRVKAAVNVPCTTHTHEYAGHCNVETTKDVNYYGLQDEYVVSGSDDGNLFIWDKKTAKLINILEGDGEVVNVIQPHPYEPMLAVSGIDHTIKIFSPDARARREAARGISIRKADTANWSSIGTRNRSRFRPVSSQEASSSMNALVVTNPDEDDEDTAEDLTLEPAFVSSSMDHRSRPLDDWGLEEDIVSEDGLASRKRMGQADRIKTANEQSRKRNDGGQWISRGMLELMNQRFRAQLGAVGADEVEGDCSVM